MHLLLTDLLTCPRCGPSFGLILLTNQMLDRRVRSGTLGCPNCRDSFEIQDGFADLRHPPRSVLPKESGHTLPVAPHGRSAPAEADKIVALLGIERGPGSVVMAGRSAAYAYHLAARVEDLAVVAFGEVTRFWTDAGTVSRVASAPGLPFFSRKMRGIVVDGSLGLAVIHEAARICAPFGRVIVLASPPEAREVLEADGLTVLAEEAETVVAARG
ncbi:MAG: hypothetical protein OSA81_12025 [Longimicrobiales bacterium]|nr:hypothetical protein [Longimicrobiales bacterium]